MARAAIGLGSNLGNRLGTLRFALQRLGEEYPVTAVSSLYLTEPIGGPDQDEFLNAIVLLETNDQPEALLARLLEIEAEAGRVRHERWGPRTLDLDLITVQGATSDTSELTLPHPRAHLRRFVVAPLAEVWPDAQLEEGRAADHLRSLVDQRALRLAKDWRNDPVQFLDRGTQWVIAQVGLFALFGIALIGFGSWPAGWRWLGLVPTALALYLMLAAASALGDAFTPFPTPRQDRLAERGVYRYVRHPMYAGMILLFAGVAILVGSVWAAGLALVTTVFFWFKAGFEEKRLRIVYPAYDDYRSQVRGRLFPGVW